ncbi:rhomboid family protein [Striga asiatica]|uniref:RHOMBOID-like protein n=1 Tax=Striga asiatica TaxID=4170 RepID=A0A5A7QHJ6_STRAF|nr:rhomboid family protein [Striga asiatica]
MMENGDLERGPAAKDRNRSYYGGGSGGGGGGGYVMAYSDSQWTSWLVPMIIVANVVMFVVIMFVNDCPRNHSGLRGDCAARFLGRLAFQPLRENPLFGPSSSTLQKLGALDWNMIVHQNQAWRLITCIWLHAGVIHLLANMLSLVFIGIRLEQQFGFVRVGPIYLLSGIGGSVLSSLFIQKSISVGASGALFGLLGAMLSELFTNWTIYSNKNFLQRVLFDVQSKPIRFIEWDGMIVNSNTFTSALFTVGFVMLFKGENANDKCSWCHYLSCVPTPRWSCDN